MHLSDVLIRKMLLTHALLKRKELTCAHVLLHPLQPNSNFHGANMKLSNMDSGFFENADFSDTVLEEAYVSNAQFKGIKIEGSDCEFVLEPHHASSFVVS